MKRSFVFFAAFVGLVLASSCGGADALAKDSDIVVRLMRTDGTQVMTQFEIYLTKNADTQLDVTNAEDFMSTRNQPSWADDYSSSRTTTELKLNFRTRGGQAPYYMFVKVPNTGANFETLKLQIDVDGEVGPIVTKDLDINTTQRVTGVRIERNAAFYD